MIGRWLACPVYPFALVALYPVQFLSANYGFFSLFSFARLTVALLIGLLILFLLTKAIVRDAGLAGLIVAVVTIIRLAPVQDPVLAVGLIAGGGLVAFAVRNLELAHNATVIANAVALSLLILPTSRIIGNHLSAGRILAQPVQFGPGQNLASPTLGPDHSLPSVMHVVLDAYGGRTALKKLFAFDNTEFTEALERLGFMVFDDVPAPYNQTLLSMSAVMNAGYPGLDKPPLLDLDNQSMRLSLSNAMFDSAVARRFRDADHNIYFSVSEFGTQRFPDYAQALQSPRETLFSWTLFDVYFLFRRLEAWGFDLFSPVTWASPIDQQVRSVLDPNVVDLLTPPFFLYLHALAPHPPFTIDSNGNSTNEWGVKLIGDGDLNLIGSPDLTRRYRSGYIDKLRYANGIVLQQFERLIAEFDGPLVVILHGDHGSASHLIVESEEKSCLMERMRTTAAIYTNVPEIRAELERTGLPNIINIYRILFAAVAGTEPVLADDQFFAKWSEPGAPIPLTGADFDRNCD